MEKNWLLHSSPRRVAMQYCRFCGSETPNNARFCAHCGSSLNTSIEGIRTQPLPDSIEEARTQPLRDRRLRLPRLQGSILTWSMLLVIAIAIIGTGIKLLPGIFYHGFSPLANASNSSTSPVLSTAPLPSTLTSCPPASRARAAVIAPLALGTHQNIVYTINTGTYEAPTSGTFERYDVTTGSKTQIIKLYHLNFPGQHSLG